MDKTPLYKYPAAYAKEHDELDAYRASYKANVTCRDAIDDAIRDHYHDNRLDEKAVKQVVDAFGFERTLYVLANTVREKDWDGRIDHRNKEWARTVPIAEDINSFGDNRNRFFIVNRAHPGLLDLFVTLTRYAYLLTQPLKATDIREEAARILRKFQSTREPNSPDGTCFMVKVQPDFLQRAKAKDIERLSAIMPFKSFTLSHPRDGKGMFATIHKDEDCNQALVLRRPSVRNQLKRTAAVKSQTLRNDMEVR